MYQHALATGLIGFRSSTLRVRVIEIRDGYAWVITASLLDVGTKLVLDASQIIPEPTDVAVTYHHKLALA